eukprot:6427-Heterococcus_DN1.PRE.6
MRAHNSTAKCCKQHASEQEQQRSCQRAEEHKAYCMSSCSEYCTNNCSVLSINSSCCELYKSCYLNASTNHNARQPKCHRVLFKSGVHDVCFHRVVALCIVSL